MALGLGALLALGLWLVGPGSRATAVSGALAPGAGEPEAPRDELVPASAPELESVAHSTVRAGRELVAVPRGRLHGRLVRAGGGPFRAERIVVLASEGDSVAETLRSDAEGRFTSERAFPRGLVRAFVRDPRSGAMLARHEARFDPESRDPWLVPVETEAPLATGPRAGDDEARLHGRVVDLAMLPVARAVVKVIPLEGTGRVAAVGSDEGGEFVVEGLAPGRQRLLVQGRFASTPPLELVLVAGANEVGTVLLAAPRPAGAIRGRLLAREESEDPFGVLVLRDLASGKEIATATPFFDLLGSGDGKGTFEFPDVPAGRYELTQIPMDGRTYEPTSLEVEPPAEGLEFRSIRSAPAGYALRVLAAESGEELASVLLLHVHGQWFGEQLSPGESLNWALPVPWIVCAQGRRAARGRFPELREDQAQPIPIEVVLESGHAEVLIFKDVASDRLLAPEFEAEFAPGLPGVSVRVDGRPVATSDADGLVLLDLARAPERVEFALPGWRVLADEKRAWARLVQLVRE